jgi:hypothetical protein
VWNKIHLEMHKPEQRIFSKWQSYRFLARNHWLHHRYQSKNFNVVFPLADYVLGTRAEANDADIRCMHEQFGTPAPIPSSILGGHPIRTIAHDAFGRLWRGSQRGRADHRVTRERARFWAEVRQGQREAESNSHPSAVDATSGRHLDPATARSIQP